MASPTIVAYPALEDHGLIGDRRTAALVAADGALDWLCAARFDGEPVFAALLDAGRGGYWKLGPRPRLLGRQTYRPRTAVLLTRWDRPEFEAELVDAMPRPGVVLRRLRCLRGVLLADFDLSPARRLRAHLWTSRPVPELESARPALLRLEQGQDLWAVLSFGEREAWDERNAQAALSACEQESRAWAGRLSLKGSRAEALARAALTIRLLSHEPTGAMAAAPTAGLPERIGGDWNADYRFCWIRDSSIAFSIVAQLGDPRPAQRWLDWVCRLSRPAGQPLQPLYAVDGRARLAQRTTPLDGYRGSNPVVFGNHAYRQVQHGSLGYLADLLLVFLERGGAWKAEYSELVRRLAGYVESAWRRPDSSLWELPAGRRYVTSMIMCWTALDRAATIGKRVGLARDSGRWAAAAEQVKRETLRLGWSSRRGAFVQRPGADALDAACALAALKGMVEADDERVLSTLEAIERDLSIGGLIHRFDPGRVPGLGGTILGQFEGAFLPATTLVAAAWAKAGRAERAEELLSRVKARVPATGLLAEAVDARSGGYLGNFPLAFSHAEYARAVLELERVDAAHAPS